jgi:hypothetical protein
LKRGAVMPSLRLVTVVAAGDPLADAFYSFGDALVESQWFAAAIGDYGVQPNAIHLHASGPALRNDVDKNAMRAYVRAAVSGTNAAPIPDGPTLYLLYLPPGIRAIDGNTINCNCSSEGGAHFAFDDAGNALGWVQRCTETQNDFLTRVASHEVLEAVTDPVPGSGFVVETPSPAWNGSPWAHMQSGDVEVGDLCVGTRVTESEWTYQRIWSTTAAAAGGDPCVPALTVPYFSTSPAADWTQVVAGTTVKIALTGWSTAPRNDWYVYAISPGDGIDISVASPRQTTLNGAVYNAINNGEPATLTVTVSKARAGTWAVIRLINRSTEEGGDIDHVWPVGIFVP